MDETGYRIIKINILSRKQRGKTYKRRRESIVKNTLFKDAKRNRRGCEVLKRTIEEFICK